MDNKKPIRSLKVEKLKKYLLINDIQFFDFFVKLYIVVMDPAELEELHKNQVKTAFINYSKDMRQQHAYLFQNVTKNAYYKHNQQRKAIMMEEALTHNQHFLNQIINYMNCVQSKQQFSAMPQTTSNNRSKIKTTVKQFYREWCGQSKEKDDYIRIVDKCKKYLKKNDYILVPGCGLGRLVFQLVFAGFGAEGNEVTYFMLFGSNFIINASEKKEQFKIYPFVHSMSYYYNQEDVFRSIQVPDICVVDNLQEEPNFAIVAGQFCEIYNDRPNMFQGIASCFFLDTANNIFDYVDTACKTLKDNGIWINFGPLLFHYKQLFNEVSIQISWETLKKYIQNSFQFLQEQFIETTYCHDPKSQMSVVYNCISFVCRKKTNHEENKLNNIKSDAILSQ